MNQFSTVLFDADGVLNDGTWISLEEDFGISRSMTTTFFGGGYKDCLVGKSDMKEVLVPYLKEWNWQGTVDDFTDYWFKHVTELIPSMKAVVEQLDARSVKTYLVTDQEKNRFEYLKSEVGYGELFPEIFVSCQMGFRKHDDGYWKYILEHIEEKDVSKVLYWDDVQENIEAAGRAGITAHLFENEEDFHSKMKEYFDFL